MTAKHLYKKRCSEGGLEGWQGGWPGSPIIGANLGTQIFFLIFDIHTNMFFYVFHGFVSSSAWFVRPSVCLAHFLSDMQNLQNGFEAGNSERPGNVLVPEEPLIILNAVPTWTKKQFYSEDF